MYMFLLFIGIGSLSETADLPRRFLYSMELDNKGKAQDILNLWLWCFNFLNLLGFLAFKRGI